MTMTSPTHALAYARICDLLRESARRTASPTAPSARNRNSTRRGLGFVQWLRRGQLGAPAPCINC